jgi:hypothetical protein
MLNQKKLFLLEGQALDDPVKFSPSQIISSTKLVRNLAMYLDEVKKRPLFILRNNKIDTVLISIEEYRELLRIKEGIK